MAITQSSHDNLTSRKGRGSKSTHKNQNQPRNINAANSLRCINSPPLPSRVIVGREQRECCI